MSVTAGTPLSVVLEPLTDGASCAVALADDAVTRPDRLPCRAAWGAIRAMTASRALAGKKTPGPPGWAADLSWLCCARPLAVPPRHRGPERKPAAMVTDMRLNHNAINAASEHPRRDTGSACCVTGMLSQRRIGEQP